MGGAGHRDRRGHRWRSTADHLARRVVDVPPRTVAHEGPVYQRPVARPESQDALNADSSSQLSRPSTGAELRATLLALLGSPHLCSRAFITEQYDRYVRGNTVLAEHADGGVLRIDESTGRGIAISTDASGRYTLLDPIPVLNSRWPRRTATSPSPAPHRSQ